MRFKYAKFYFAAALFTFLLAGCKSSIVDDPTSLIQFNVPEKAHVVLTVENNYGTVMATLVDGVKEAGDYQVTFNADNLAEGVYYYTLEMKGTDSDFYQKLTKQMLLIK